MHLSQLISIMEGLFPKEILEKFKDDNQYGINNALGQEIQTIGYSVNLTKDIIEQARKQKVDLILTHHNIWEDYFELREDCLSLLVKYGISHYYSHLPLDSAPFGPSKTLAHQLGLSVVEEFCKWDDLSFGVIGEFSEPISLQVLSDRLERAMGHAPRVWKNNHQTVKRVGLVAGSGGDLETLHEAHALHCDTYITGEKKLKTILYCQHIQMNFVLGSHTFTELGAVEAFSQKIQERVPELKRILLHEEYLE